MRRLLNQSVRFALTTTMLVVVAGCGRSVTNGPGDVPNLREWVADVKARPAPPIEPLPSMLQFEQFMYEAQSMRDPFNPMFSSDANSAGPRPITDRRKEALESYPLDSLDMVGTIGKPGSLVGLVMGPDKITQRIVPGNYMGQSDGRVTGVFEDRIELVELVPDGANGWLERSVTVTLDDE